MGPLRRAEQRAAAEEVGVTDVRFLGYPDGRLELTLDLRRDISRVIRQVRPQRVLTSSPERFWERVAASHPDHMTVGESTLRAVYPDARNPFAFPELLDDEGLEAWAVSEVWLGASPRADHAVDVTDVVDRKFAALGRHVTQVSHQPEGQLEEFVTAWMRQTGPAVRTARGPARGGLPRGPHHVTWEACPGNRPTSSGHVDADQYLLGSCAAAGRGVVGAASPGAPRTIPGSAQRGSSCPALPSSPFRCGRGNARAIHHGPARPGPNARA